MPPIPPRKDTKKAPCCCRFECVGPFVSDTFQDFQHAYYASFTQQPVGGLASGFFYISSAIFWGFSGHFSCCFGPINFAFRRDGSHCGPLASSVRPNFHHCILRREPHCLFYFFSSVATTATSWGLPDYLIRT